MKDHIQEKIKSVFGKEYSKLCENPSLVYKCLEDPDPKKRMLALAVLHRSSKQDPDLLVSICKSLVLNDENEKVVGNAIDAIGNLRSGTFDDEVSKLLANFALDSNKTIKNRCAAYRAIEKIRSPVVPFQGEESLHDRAERSKSRLRMHKENSKQRRACSLDQIDWALVNEVAKQ